MDRNQIKDLIPGIYCRKSQESEEKQVLSIPAQKEEAERLISYWEIVKSELYEEAKSAHFAGEREIYKRMIKDLHEGKINAIICWKLDRLARNMVDGGLIIDLLQKGIIKAIITPTKVYLPNENALLMSVEFGSANQFSRDLSVNVKRGQAKKASMGYPHGLAALGFKNDRSEEKGNRKWLVDEDRFNIIKQMFSMFLSGSYSGTQLYEWAVNEVKFTTRKSKRIGGKFITYSRIYEILKDPIFAGFFYYGGERYELAPELPRMITEAEHYKVRRMLGDRSVPKTKEHLTPYSGFIKSPYGEFIGPDIKLQLICECKYKFSYQNKDCCPKCNKTLAEIKSPKYLSYHYYYNVSRRKKKLKARYIEESCITDYLISYVKENLQLSPALADWCRRNIQEMKDREVEHIVTIEQGRKSHLEQLLARKDRARQYLNDGVTSPDDYKKDAEKIDREVAELKTQSIQRQDWSIRMREIVDLTQSFVDVLSSDDTKAKRVVLKKFKSNLIWNEEKMSITNAEEFQTLIDGLSAAKQKNIQFEPENIIDVSEQNPIFRDVCSTLLPR